MTHDRDQLELVATTDLPSYFQQSLQTALTHNRIKAEHETVSYLAQLLSHFMRSEHLFDKNEDGMCIKPLAFHYAEALQQTTPFERNRSLQRLGDVALFIAGLFAESLERKLVDIDYYIAMGGTAYGYLANNDRRVVFAQVFAELSEKFVSFVDVLAEIYEHSDKRNDRDVMRIYDFWSKTGSQRAARQLRELGIEPIAIDNPQRRH